MSRKSDSMPPSWSLAIPRHKGATPTCRNPDLGTIDSATLSTPNVDKLKGFCSPLTNARIAVSRTWSCRTSHPANVLGRSLSCVVQPASVTASFTLNVHLPHAAPSSPVYTSSGPCIRANQVTASRSANPLTDSRSKVGGDALMCSFRLICLSDDGSIGDIGAYAGEWTDAPGRGSRLNGLVRVASSDGIPWGKEGGQWHSINMPSPLSVWTNGLVT